VTLGHLKWVFFDLGCTLIDESAALHDAHSQLLDALATRGVSTSHADLEQALKPAWEAYQPSPIVHVLSELTGSREEARATLRDINYDKSLEKPYPETERLLAALAGKVNLGVIANQSPGTEARLRSYGLYDYFQICLASAEEGVSKPKPDLFHRALERADCPPEDAVMIGDRIDNDVRPAKILGWRTIRVLQGHGRHQSPRDGDDHADHTIETIGDAQAILAR